MQRNNNTVVSLLERRKDALNYLKETSLIQKDGQLCVSVLNDALADASIIAGDMLAVRRGERAANGELALVDTPYGMLIRYAFQHPDYLCLTAANPAFPKLFLPHKEVKVFGPVRWLLRDYRSVD